MNCRTLTFIAGFAALLTSGGLRAQTAPAPSGAATKASDIVELSAFTVNSQREVGYQATTTVSASRLNVPLKEVPLNIAVLTQDFVMDSVNFNHRDALRWHAAVDDKSIRGFGTEEFFRNGFLHFSDVAGYMVNRIEIIRGPTAVLNGPLTPGGAINFITKQAAPGKNFGEARVILGTGNDHERFNGYFDYNIGALGSTGPGAALSGRLVVAHQYATGAARGTEYELNSILPSLKWQPTKNTTVTVEYYGYDIHDREDRPMGRDILFTPAGNTLAGGQLPLAAAYGIPYKTGWYGPDAKIEEDLDDVTVAVSHAFGQDVLVDLGFNRHARDFSPTPGTQPPIQGQSTFNVFLRPGATAGSANPNDYRLERELQMFTLDAVIEALHGSITWQPDFLGRRGDHRVQAGFDTVDLTRAINRDRPYQVGNPSAIFRDVFEVRNHATDNLEWFSKNSGQYTYRRVNALRDELDQSNIYVNHHGKWLGGKLVTLLGVYRSEIEQGQRNYLAGTFVKQYDGGKTLPQLGAVYFVNDNLGFYGNWSESLRVSGPNRTNVEDFLPPTRGEMLDLGVKLELLNDRVIFNASFYTINEVDRSQEFPAGSGLFASIGEVQSRGVDADVFYYPVRNWTIMASYAGNQGVTIENDANRANIGRKVPGFIKHKFALWTKYALTDGALKGWAFGGGWQYRGKQFREYRFGTTETWFAPLTRLDVFAQYNGRALGWNYEVALNVRNLTRESNTSNMTPLVINQAGYKPGTNDPFEFKMQPDVLLSFAVKF